MFSLGVVVEGDKCTLLLKQYSQVRGVLLEGAGWLYSL